MDKENLNPPLKKVFLKKGLDLRNENLLRGTPETPKTGRKCSSVLISNQLGIYSLRPAPYRTTDLSHPGLNERSALDDFDTEIQAANERQTPAH